MYGGKCKKKQSQDEGKELVNINAKLYKEISAVMTNKCKSNII